MGRSCVKLHLDLHVVPPLLGFLANSPTVTPEVVGSTRDILVAAAPVSSYLTEKMMEKAPNVVVREGKRQSWLQLGEEHTLRVVVLTSY